MKNFKLILLALSALMAIGCAKEKKADSASATPYVTIPSSGPYTPTITGPGNAPGSVYGGTAPLEIVSVAVMSQYTGRPMNNPTNIKINLNLVESDTAKHTYGGTVTVSYTDNGIPYQGYFTGGSSTQATQYNVWFSYGGNPSFHGFFEDFMGGIVVTVDNVIDLGDGKPLDNASGSIWFKNFGLTYAPHPPTYCWFVSLGPYDCRAWPSGNGVNTYAAVNPDNGYVMLGRFNNMSLKAAFNGGTTAN